MKKLLLLFLLAMAALVGCSDDVVVLNDQSDRIADLERRADLNNQLDTLQSQLIQANADAIATETQARIAGDQELDSALQQEMADRAAQDIILAQLIADEEQARIEGDLDLVAALNNEIAARIAGDQQNSQALQDAVFLQSITNIVVQTQLNQINNKFPFIYNKLSSLQSAVNNLNSDLDDLEQAFTALSNDLITLGVQLQAQIDDLSTSLAATQLQLDQEGVKLYKCNNLNSTERIMKINGYFYGVINRVTTKNVEVVTGSSSQTFTTPDMCKTSDGYLKLPNSGGQCTPVSGPNASTLIPGQTITVPSYTTKSVKVVTSVEIALDMLKDGSYMTTDGSTNCSFSISGNGTVASGLIPVQGGL